MSTLTVKELSHPAGEVIKIAAGKTLDLKSQGSVTMPTGSVIQVVSGSSATTAAAAVNHLDILTVSITPSSTSSKVLITASLSAFSNINHVAIQVLRNGTLIGQGSGSSLSAMVSASFDNNNYGSNGNASFGSNAICYLDSPSSTSAVSYVFRIKQASSEASIMYVNRNVSGWQGVTSNATLQEIQG